MGSVVSSHSAMAGIVQYLVQHGQVRPAKLPWLLFSRSCLARALPRPCVRLLLRSTHTNIQSRTAHIELFSPAVTPCVPCHTCIRTHYALVGYRYTAPLTA